MHGTAPGSVQLKTSGRDVLVVSVSEVETRLGTRRLIMGVYTLANNAAADRRALLRPASCVFRPDVHVSVYLMPALSINH